MSSVTQIQDRNRPPVPGKIVGLIRGTLPALVPSEVRVAEFVLAAPSEAIHLTVTELATAANTSTSTVMRFCQRLGFKGYQDFKIALARDDIPLMRALPVEIDDEDAPAQILSKVIGVAADAVARAATSIDHATFTRAVEVLDTASRILVVGVGRSAPIAQDSAFRLLTIGLRTEAPLDVHIQHMTATSLTDQDVCLVIDHTGRTRETLMTATSAARAGAVVIAVTSFFHSSLIEVADIALVSGTKDVAFRLESMTSRLAHLSVLDALGIALAVRNRDRTQTAQEPYNALNLEHRLKH